jgi:ATP-dependent Lon protease
LQEKEVFLVTQTNFEQEEPEPDDLYPNGCIGRILQTARASDGTAKVLVEGIARARVVSVSRASHAWMATVQRQEYRPLEPSDELEAVVRATLALFEQYAQKNPRLPEDICQSLQNIEHPTRLLHLVIGHLTIKPGEKIALLQHEDVQEALYDVCRVMSREVELLNIEHRIYGEVRKQIDDQQRSYFLHEQMKVIERELGRKGYDEVREYRERIEAAKMPEAVAKVAQVELEKLDRTPGFSPEGTVIRNYLDWLCDLPWSVATEDNLDLAYARKVLDDTHYGLKEPKQRVLEYLAVRTLQSQAPKARQRAPRPIDDIVAGTVLCFVGPPGVGKTSLARAIATALGRKFVRISLGGIRDEAEIRGHRRTYVGALPGRIIQGLKKAGTRNPVMLLDEIDKLFADFRGDPSAALLEALDPEQNVAFNDHYLEVDVDLSDVMFICTANIDETIHPTLRDRMETIELSSYTEPEKIAIAQRFLLDKERARAGIPCRVRMDDACITRVIRDYTHEAGVRNLSRSIAQVMRKIALELVSANGARKRSVTIPQRRLKSYLGTPKHRLDNELPLRVPGVAVGLAWTETGGEILKVEVSVLEGKGDVTLTGQLGDIMQESARAAMTYVRKRAKQLKLSAAFFSKHDIHVHVPEGAIPKDGPSAGITVATALYSALSRKRIRSRLAMTGEITLGGTVLAVGGLKEKLLAAHRAGVTDVLIPQRSVAELDDVPEEVRAALAVHPVANMDEVIELAFAPAAPRAGRTRRKH